MLSQNTPLRSLRQIRESLSPSIYRPGVHSTNYLLAAGFTYTGVRDTARCAKCGLEVSHWTGDMHPFTIHSQQSPHCSFVRSIRSSSTSTTAVRHTSLSSEEENPSIRQGIESIDSKSLINTFAESHLLQQVRRRTFSHWSDDNTLSSAGMIEAGFFHCNVSDRVICIYCNLICQQWTPYVDDPWEVHKTLSPNCIYVKALLTRRRPLCIINDNGNSVRATTVRPSFAPNNINSLAISGSVRPAVQNNNRNAIPNNKVPSVDDVIQANYFNTDAKNMVTCSSCNGSLQIWGSNNHPMIEHARWFPNCPYIRQLYGTEMFRRIQQSNRAQQKGARRNESWNEVGSDAMSIDNLSVNSGQLWIPNERALSRAVVARLALPISRRLLDQGFKLSIIKRCWEDQLRLKQDDFVSECDLYIACVIVQKQIEYINGKKENIVIPSERMRQFREHATREEAEAFARRQAAARSALRGVMWSSSESTSSNRDTRTTTSNQDQSNDSEPANPCVLCLTEERRLACIPCGHLATCVPCGHSLRICPICRRKIEAFVRVYI